MKFYQQFVKRCLDVMLASAVLIILSPMILITAVFVRIFLGSPIIFKQERPGRNEKLFRLYKFRTMIDKRDEKGNLYPDEQRLTKFGRILRTTSLDELPELLNIIKGDMSIVGPRPLLERYLPYYKKEERIRHSIRPGLTGLAQISGRNNLSWDERLYLDVKYVRNITFVNDCNIILKTVGKVLKRSDVASGKQLIMQDLDVERFWMKAKDNNINDIAEIKYKELSSEDIGIYKKSLIYLMEIVLYDNLTQDYPDDLAEQYVQKMPGYIQDGSAIIVGGFFKDNLIGFSWAYEMNIYGERRLHIDMIGVEPQFRKRGIAHSLFQVQVQEAIRREIRIIEAMVTRANENSYNWFHSIGFADERVKVRMEISND